MGQFLDRREVERRTGLSTSGLYRLVRAGRFPQQVQISSGRVCWDSDEVEEWQRAKLAERSLPTKQRANVRRSLEARAARKGAPPS